MPSIADRLEKVRQQIAIAEKSAGRAAGSVDLIAVSKLHPASAIREAYAAGQRDFGENYVQELVSKAEELRDLEGLRFHLIGHLQSNKARQIVADVACVHSVDSASLAREIGKRAHAIGRTIPVLIQVNVAAEAQKSGCTIANLPALVATVIETQGVTLTGLMTIPPQDDDPEASRPHFARLRELLATLPAMPPRAQGELSQRAQGELSQRAQGELSMGMSHDLEVAIREGATMVRVGTAIFGERPLT
jgi:hypothetical protein